MYLHTTKGSAGLIGLLITVAAMVVLAWFVLRNSYGLSGSPAAENKDSVSPVEAAQHAKDLIESRPTTLPE